MVALPDESLVAKYASGCNEAFDVLLRRHQSRLFSYILSVVKTAIWLMIYSRTHLSRP